MFTGSIFTLRNIFAIRSDSINGGVFVVEMWLVTWASDIGVWHVTWMDFSLRNFDVRIALEQGEWKLNVTGIIYSWPLCIKFYRWVPSNVKNAGENSIHAVRPCNDTPVSLNIHLFNSPVLSFFLLAICLHTSQIHLLTNLLIHKSL